MGYIGKEICLDFLDNIKSNVNNIKKPSYWAYYFLNMLGDEIVRIDNNYIITRQGNEYRIIIWNYCYYTDEFADGDRSKLTDTARDDVFKLKDIDIQIDLGAEGTGIVYTLGESTSAYHNWLKLGAPQYPTATEIIKLKEQSVPKKEQITLSAVSETLKSHEVKMYIVHKTLTG